MRYRQVSREFVDQCINTCAYLDMERGSLWLEILDPLINKKKPCKVGPPPPLAKLSGSAHEASLLSYSKENIGFASVTKPSLNCEILSVTSLAILHSKDRITKVLIN